MLAARARSRRARRRRCARPSSPARSACCAVGGLGCPGPRRVGDRGRVADRPHVREALDLAVAVGPDAPAVVERQPEPRDDRVRLDAGRPGHRPRRDDLAGRRARPMPSETRSIVVDVQDLDAAPAQLAGRGLGEVGARSPASRGRAPRRARSAARAAASAGRGRRGRRRSPAARRCPRGPRSRRRRRRRSAARVRVSSSSTDSAVSSVWIRRLRSAIASESVLKPTACSASPGIGSVREIEPSATISWS